MRNKKFNRQDTLRLTQISSGNLAFWCDKLGLVVPERIVYNSPRKPKVWFTPEQLFELSLIAELRQRKFSSIQTKNVLDFYRTHKYPEANFIFFNGTVIPIDDESAIGRKVLEFEKDLSIKFCICRIPNLKSIVEKIHENATNHSVPNFFDIAKGSILDLDLLTDQSIN